MTEVRTVSATGGEKGEKPERYDLIPVEPLAEVARLYGWGAEKYDDRNWELGFEWHKAYAALQRHANAWWNGEETDEESGLSHMSAVVFHAFTLMQFAEHHPQYDDRSKLTKVGDMPDPENVIPLDADGSTCTCTHPRNLHWLMGGGWRGTKYSEKRGSCRAFGCTCMRFTAP